MQISLKSVYRLILVLITLCSLPAVAHIDDAAVQAALRALYTETNGDEWSNNSGWNIPAAENIKCKMGSAPTAPPGANGLTCSDTGLLTKIYLKEVFSATKGTLPDLSALTALTSLNLSGLKLTNGVLPASIGKLTTLTALVCNYCEITTLPNEMKSLVNMRTLDLSTNAITTLPVDFGDMVEMHYLALSKNGLSTQTLPASLVKMTKLSTLNLDQNSLGTFPELLTQLVNLTTLNLRTNSMEDVVVPASIGNWQKMSFLSISGNYIAEVPDALATLTELTTLKIHGNRLTKLPEQIGNLNKLREFRVFANKLTSLPDSVCKLTSLTFWRLDSNQLQTLPSCFTALNKLYSLNLANNLFQVLPPEVLALTKLTNLDVSGNGLSSLPAGITALTILNSFSMGDNQFETLPVELSQLTSLNRLRANKNRLQSFPLFLKSLPNLAYLDIAGNMIREDLMWGVTDFTALTTLSGRYNALYASDPVMNAKIESLNNSSFPQFQTLPVSNVQALDSAGSINLSWDLPLQNASTGRRNGFFVYSGPSISGPWTQITDVPGSHEVSTTLPALEAGTQVWLTVGSYNNAHFSNNNVVVSVLAPAISVIPEASNINDPAVQTALTTIYTSTGGDNWTNKAGWSATGPIACTADGISCDGSDNVVNLNFYSNNLVGTLPPEIGNLVHLTVLTLSWNSGLDVVLTDTIGGLTQLTDLNAVAVGSFNELPVEFGQLTLLETVDITSNNCLIPSIPDSFANLVNLVDLRVSGCQLTTVPASFGSLPMLKTLDLTSQPSLSSLPAEFGNLPSLEVLQLYNDGFTEIPAAVMALPKLKTLKISRNAIVEIPDAIASLTELEILEIEDAKISVISEQIGTLSKLRNLNLEKNQLTTLPLALFDLPTLNKLYLKDNQLASISDRLGNLTTLTELLLNENQLTEIPTTIGNLVNLTRFDVSDNQLTALPVEIGNLVNVTSGDWPRRGPGFNDNLLTEIPKELGNLLLIKELWLQDNQLTTLPDEIYNLTALTKFYIYGNSIPSLSSRIGELSDLTNLVLNENPITELPDEVWSLSNLTSLGANDCQITQLNEGLGNLLKLTSLQMWGNNISSLPASIANLTHLKYLYVNDNQLEQFPEAITGLKNLKVIKMHGNKMVGELPASIVNIPLMSSHNFTLAYNALWTDDIAVQNYMSVYTSRSIWAGVERHQTWLPGNFLATASNGQANLSWDLPLHYGHSGQRTGYIIYRADTATGPFTPIEEITDAYAISTTLNTLAEGDHFLAIASYNDTHSYNKNKVISSLSPAIKISILKAVRDISLAAQPVGETSPSNTLAGTLTATDTNNATGSFSYALAVKGTSMQGLCSADTANASFSINGDQLETFMPLTPGSHDVCVQSSYVDGVTFQKTITIQVSAAPQVSSAATISIDEDSVLNFSLAATDAEGDKLSFKLKAGQSLPAWFNLQAVLDSTVTTIAGTGAAGFVDDVPALQAQFENLYGIAIDKNGVIYVSDSENNRIRKISNNGIVSTFAGSGVMGHKDDTGTLAQFARPRGLAIDDNGFLYVADRSNSVIRKISPAGVVTTLAGTVGQSGSMDDASVGDGSQATFGNIHGIAVDKQGRVYVTEASAHTIRRISVSGDVTTTFAGTAGAQGIDDDSTAGDGSQAKFNTPISVVVADDGYVYVTDKNNHRIRKISPDGSITETLLGSDMGFKDDDIVGDGAKAKIWSPYGIDMDSQGNLYLADMGNNRFRKISPDGDITAVLAGTGQDGSTDDTVPGNGTQATFLAPYELTLAGDGVVYVVDEGHHAIRKIEEFYNYTFTGTPLNADVGQFTVVVEVTDGVNIVEQTITVTVNNTNDGPTEIKISKASFLESIMVSGASAGSLSTIDVDQNDSFTYVLVSSSSAVAGTCSDDTGNTSFTLSGDKLKTAAALTAGSYGLCVQSTDSGAAAIKQTLLITVVDDVAPTVSIKNVLANSNAPFTVTFTFSEVVNNFTVEDITLGNATASAFKQNGNSYTALITPTADGEVSIVVKANVLTDASGNGNVASGIEKSQYDATAPMVNILDVPQNSNKAFTVTYQFSEAVSGFDLADVTAGLLNATASNFLAVDADTYTALITAQAEGTISIIVQAGAALDVVNNASLEATAVTSEYDITAVTVEIINAPTATNKAFTAQFNFSKAVSGFDVADIVAVNATLSDFKVISPSKYSAVVSPVAEGQVSLNIAGDSAVDVAGNANKPATQVHTIYDITAPTVEIENVAANSNAAFTARFVFSEVVTGFALTDISLSNATGNDFIALDGKTYTALITPVTEGAFSVGVKAGMAADAAENLNTAATSQSGNYDNTAPRLVIKNVPANSKGAFTVTFSFNEAVSNFSEADIILTNASISAFKQNGNTYTALITPIADGEVSIAVKANALTDASGNGNVASNIEKSLFDVTSPSVSVLNVPTFSNKAFTVTYQFSEAVSGFDLADVTAGLLNATASNFVAVDADTYTALITAQAAGQVSIIVQASAALDVVNNASLEATAVTSEYDITAVTVEIINAPTATNKAFTAQFNFSKAVSGFDVADIAAVNATLSDFKVISLSKYSAVVSPVAEGQVSLNIAGDSAVDAAGNANKPATQVNTTYDITAPTVAIENVQPNSNAAFTARFVFSEVVTGFALADISLSNATASDFSAVDGKTYTALISPTAEGALSVAVIAEVASDAAGNQNSAATTLSSLYDITAPTLVIEDVPTHSKGGFTVTFSFSEAVSDFTAQDVLLNNAVVSLFQKVNDTSYTALIIPTMPGKVTVDVNAAAVIDIAANNNTAADQASSVYDNAAPSVGFTHLPASGETSFTVNIVFSEIVSGFGLNDISATHAQLSNLQGSGSQYSVQVSADGSGQDISLSIAADSANDIAGNGNTASAITLIEMNRSATVVIQGDAVVGQTLKAMITDEDGIEGVSITYLWLNGNTALASTAKYELTAADLGAKIRVQVSFMDVLGNPESAVSEETDTVFSSQQDALDILAAISSCVDVSDAGIYQTAGIHGVTESILPIINNAIANAESSSDIDSAAEIQALVDVILLAQDSDMDGLPDFLEGLDGRDSDGDGLADYNDNDADNDGIADGIDANLDLTDSDADGIIDVLDADVGNDCVIDMDKNDDNFDGMNDAFKQLADLNIDADGDGLANHLDLDSDNDSLLDIVETQGLDANGDGLLDALGSLAQLPLADDDSDGIPNFLDVSSNGITSDITEAGLEQHDSDGDGRVDNMLDGDKDGIMDVVDSSNKEFGALSEDLGLPSGVNEVEPDGEIKSDGGQWGYLFMLMLFNVCLYRRFIRND